MKTIREIRINHLDENDDIVNVEFYDDTKTGRQQCLTRYDAYVAAGRKVELERQENYIDEKKDDSDIAQFPCDRSYLEA